MRSIGLSALLCFACQSGGAPAPATPVESPRSPPSWCSAVEIALAHDSLGGFRCLGVPNFLVTGFYGPERNPERSDFVNACFDGDEKAAARLRMSVRPAGSLGFSYSARQSLDVGAGLDLGFLGPWAPKLTGHARARRSVEISVALEDAEVRVLSSVAEILGQEFRDTTDDSELRRSLDGCITSACASDGEKIVYTAKVLAAVPVITLKSVDSETQSLSLSEAAASFTVDKQRSETGNLVLRAKDKLNIAALIEPAAPAFRAAHTCADVVAARTRREVLSGLREIGLRALSGRALGEVPTLAQPLRAATAGTDGAFSSNEQAAILGCIETVEGSARQFALPKPTNALCAVRSMAQTVLTSSGEDNHVHGVLADVVQPLHERLTELANGNSLPCAEPVWFLDLDRDGYGDRNKSRRSSTQPPGYVANSLDCYDENPEAHPGQTRFFTQHRGDGNYDYDCDGRETKREETASGGCKEISILGFPTRCWADAGWEGATPACGQQGKWLAECEVNTLSCTAVRETRDQQQCR
jgi:hypothetical protein